MNWNVLGYVILTENRSLGQQDIEVFWHRKRWESSVNNTMKMSKRYAESSLFSKNLHFPLFPYQKAGEDASFLSPTALACRHHYAFQPSRYIHASLCPMSLPRERGHYSCLSRATENLINWKAHLMSLRCLQCSFAFRQPHRMSQQTYSPVPLYIS